MKRIFTLIALVLFLPALVFGVGGPLTHYAEKISPQKDNRDVSIQPTGTGNVILGGYSGVLKASSGTISTGLIDLASEISGDLPLANGINFVNLTEAQTVGGVKTFSSDVLMSGTGQLQLPVGTTAQRSVTPANGMIRGNSEENSFEGYLNGQWGSIGGGASGSRLNLVEHPSFEKDVTEGTCNGCTAAEEPVIKLATSNNEKSLAITINALGSGFCGDYVLDKSTSSEWHDNLNIVKFLYAKLPPSTGLTYTFISRAGGGIDTNYAGNNIEKVISGSRGVWTPWKLETLSNTVSNGYSVKFCNNTGTAVTETFYLDETEIRPTNSSDVKNVSDVDTDLVHAGVISFSAATTNPTKGTVSIDKISVKRDGDYAEIVFQYAQSTAGTAGSGIYYVDMPNSLVIDTTKLDVSGVPVSKMVGLGAVTTSGDGRDIHVYADSANRVGFYYANSTNISVSSASHPLSNAGFSISGRFRVPIQGWQTGRVDATRQKKEITSENFFFVSGAYDATEATLTSAIKDQVPDTFASSVAKSGTSNFTKTITINSGVFSEIPKCQATGGGENASAAARSGVKVDYSRSNSTSTSLVFYTRDNAGANDDISFDFVCIKADADFQKFLDLFGLFKDTQIKKVEDKFVTTETEWGMWNGKQLYRRCFELVAASGSTVVVGNIGAGRTPKTSVKVTATVWQIVGGRQISTTDRIEFQYDDGTGDVSVLPNGRTAGAGTNFCVDYTK